MSWLLAVAAMFGVPQDVCAPLPTTAAAPRTFVILIGYPEPPPGRTDRLEAVDDDVGQMHTFFRALEPEASFVHLRPGAKIRARHPQLAFRDPSWRAVLESVAEVERQIAEGGGPARVFVYYAGHGERRDVDGRHRTRIFLERDGDAPGFDGLVSSAELAASVLTPLGRVARVHLIVDACQSYYLLSRKLGDRSVRALKRRPNRSRQAVDDFVRDHPGVGVLLATNGAASTYEHSTYGGLFSFAVRSAAIGHADTGTDGRITYGEMAHAIEAILAHAPGTGRPGVVGPGHDPDATFIDYRAQKNVARLCVPAQMGRVELSDASRASHATVHPATDMALYLPRDGIYHLTDGTQQTRQLRPDDGPVHHHLTPVDRQIERGAFEGKMLPDPLQVIVDAPPSPPRWTPLRYSHYGLVTGLTWHPDGGPAQVPFRPELLVTGGVGRGALSGHLEAGYDYWRADHPGGFRHRAHGITLRAGVGWVLADGAVEWSIGGLAGGGLMLQVDDGADETLVGGRGDAVGLMTLRIPVANGRTAARLDLRGGLTVLQIEDEQIATVPTVGLLFGWEYESSGD